MDINKTCYLFFDFDGTVTADIPVTTLNGTVELCRILPESHVDAIRAAHGKGHKIFICTGRSRGSLKAYINSYFPHARELPWDGLICGASDMWYDGKQLGVTHISRDECFLWFDYCKRTDRLFYYNGELFSVPYDFRVPHTDGETEKMREDIEHQLLENPLTNLSVRPAATDMDMNKTALNPIHLPTYSDVYAPSCDKGRAITRFCELIGADIGQTACFGDSANDLEMFAVCNTRVAMRKAPEPLKKLATYVAESEYGVSEGIEHIFGL